MTVVANTQPVASPGNDRVVAAAAGGTAGDSEWLLLDGSVGGGGVGSGKRSRGVPRALVLLLVALFLGTIYRDLLPIVWPLYIRAHFGWDETQCAHH